MPAPAEPCGWPDHDGSSPGAGRGEGPQQIMRNAVTHSSSALITEHACRAHFDVGAPTAAAAALGRRDGSGAASASDGDARLPDGIAAAPQDGVSTAWQESALITGEARACGSSQAGRPRRVQGGRHRPAYASSGGSCHPFLCTCCMLHKQERPPARAQRMHACVQGGRHRPAAS